MLIVKSNSDKRQTYNHHMRSMGGHTKYGNDEIREEYTILK